MHLDNVASALIVEDAAPSMSRRTSSASPGASAMLSTDTMHDAGQAAVGIVMQALQVRRLNYQC